MTESSPPLAHLDKDHKALMAKIYGGSESRQRIALIEKLLAIGAN